MLSSGPPRTVDSQNGCLIQPSSCSDSVDQLGEASDLSQLKSSTWFHWFLEASWSSVNWSHVRKP